MNQKREQEFYDKYDDLIWEEYYQCKNNDCFDPDEQEKNNNITFMDIFFDMYKDYESDYEYEDDEESDNDDDEIILFTNQYLYTMSNKYYND